MSASSRYSLRQQAYMLFAKSCRPTVKLMFPSMNGHQITSELGKLWANMSEESHQEWERKFLANLPEKFQEQECERLEKMYHNEMYCEYYRKLRAKNISRLQKQKQMLEDTFAGRSGNIKVSVTIETQ
jgi:hypothetical protein